MLRNPMTLMSRFRTVLPIRGGGIATIAVAVMLSPGAPALVTDYRTNDELSVSVGLPSHRILAGTREHDVAVTIAARPHGGDLTTDRALALALVIDRSGSMRGLPLENAKAAARSVLQHLDRHDAFSIVTYSSGAEAVVPMQRATEANKTAARSAIQTINDESSTCISCGLATGAYEVTHSPDQGDSLRRILLISDGQANAGTSDRDELTTLAGRLADDGGSLSTVGVGLDFDERTMRRLAAVGRGNYYFVEDTVSLSALFRREIEALNQTVASNVLLTLHPGPRVQILTTHGSPMTQGRNGEVVVPVADIRGGESRSVVFRIAVTDARVGSLAVSTAELRWRAVPDGAMRVSRATVDVEIVNEPGAVAASFDPVTVEVVERARSARALEEAAAAYDRDGLPGARWVLERRSQSLRANPHLDPDVAAALALINEEAIQQFASDPSRAKKTTSVKSYELAR